MASFSSKLAAELSRLVESWSSLTPSVSLALSEDDGLITSSWGATPETLFQAASISKSVTALLTLRLVAEGTLELDTDIAPRIRSWKVPALETSNGPWKPRITLRQLLWHGAGLGLFGFPGYARDEPLPLLQDVLDGRAPANTPPVKVEGIPGLLAAYSGGGYTVLQQLLEDATGRELGDLAAARIFDPLGMESANFEQPLSAELEPTAALPFSGGRPVEGGWQVYPELAAGGMWCTPTDLVRFATGIQASYQGEHGAVIPQSLAVEMLTPQMPGWGLGVGLYGHSRSPWFGHTGGNAGYRCQFIASAERGPAVAVMTNSDEGGELVPAILNHLAGRSNWKGLVPRVDFDGSYETATGAILVLQAKAAGALLQVPGQDPLRFDVAEETRLVAAGGLISITLHLDLAGRASGLTLRQREGEVVATRRS